MQDIHKFDWQKELNDKVIESLVKTFGIDWLLFEDKKGGDVDTIHNVRQGIWATEEEKNKYDNREKYNSEKYHSDENYIKRGKIDKAIQRDGKLIDSYTGENISINANRHLDHIISAKEIHDDPGRVLARKSGVKLANRDSNFNSTFSSLNQSKSDSSMSDFVNKIPNKISDLEKNIAKEKSIFDKMPENTPEERHKKRQKKDEIQKKEQKLEYFKKADPKKMLEADEKARNEYNKTINQAYYKSSKFISSTGKAAISQGIRMGTREILGFILAEAWFELKEHIPRLLIENKQNFELEKFFKDIREVLKNIWQRIKSKFSSLITKFNDSAIGGMLSSISTTIINTFFTTGKTLVRFIREIWGSLVKAIRELVFNPNKLPTGQLLKNVFNLISVGVVTALGASLTLKLSLIFTFPYGELVATFLGTLATSIATLGVVYFLQYSKTCRKLWDYLDKFKSKADFLLEYYTEINKKLDECLLEIAQTEFAIDVNELNDFANNLTNAKTETEKTEILSKELDNRNIKLSFNASDPESVRNWLKSLSKK